MKRMIPDHETLLEIGLIAFVGLLVSLLGVLAVSWLAGSAKRSRRHDKEPPAADSVSNERHQHVAVAAAR
jgi:hypothetical protein